LPASSAGAVTQSKRKQNNPGQGEQNKKQQRKNNDRHGRRKIRRKKEKVRRIRRLRGLLYKSALTGVIALPVTQFGGAAWVWRSI
jgi:hypothetical protein